MRKELRQFLLLVFLTCLCAAAGTVAQNIDIAGPAGGGSFGAQVMPLPNGNIVVIDPGFDSGTTTDAGAIYLYNGASGALISTTIGVQLSDSIGSGGAGILTDGDFLVRSPSWDKGSVVDASALTRCSGTTGCPAAITAANSLTGTKSYDGIGAVQVSILASGDYIVISPFWDNGFSTDVGAVTWCSKTSGCPTTINSTNSLIGSHTDDKIGYSGATILSNGNYAVISPMWNKLGDFGPAGAVTFGNGATGAKGVVSAANSLVGVKMGDRVGGGGVVALPSGNYVVLSPEWDNGALINAGAATFGNGTTGVSGTITIGNSLIGQTQAEGIGTRGITVLTNGNYVLAAPYWNNGSGTVGAVVWASGTTGISGTITAANSLTGSSDGDWVGSKGVVALTNGNYVVASPYFTNGDVIPLGAATWCNGGGGCTGVVSESNSIYGGPAGGQVADGGVYPLANGNFVVCSPFLRTDTIDQAGAATWGNGTTGTAGMVSEANSLMGSSPQDRVCIDGIHSLTNGNYLVRSSQFDAPGALNAGAVTFGNGSSGVSGQISAANSLVGSKINDHVGNGGIANLTNGNYVVSSPEWDNGAIADTGAATWASGSTGISGVISTGNSLIGTSANDHVGSIAALSNGNYVAISSEWDIGAWGNVGAVTWARGSTGITGEISAANSLVGSAAGDSVGAYGIIQLPGGNYMVRSPLFDHDGINAAGAFTKCNGSIGARGTIDAGNSVFGTTANSGTSQNFVFDAVNDQYIIGRPADNTVTLWRIAASASIAGMVTDANGTPIRNAIVSLTSQGGQRITAQTGSLGFYLFENVQTGQAYTISVSAKRYRFDLLGPVFIDSNLANLDFTARPNE